MIEEQKIPEVKMHDQPVDVKLCNNQNNETIYQDYIVPLCCIKCKNYSNISVSKYISEHELAKMYNEFLCLYCSNSIIDNQNLVHYINQQVSLLISHRNQQFKGLTNSIKEINKKIASNIDNQIYSNFEKDKTIKVIECQISDIFAILSQQKKEYSLKFIDFNKSKEEFKKSIVEKIDSNSSNFEEKKQEFQKNILETINKLSNTNKNDMSKILNHELDIFKGNNNKITNKLKHDIKKFEDLFSSFEEKSIQYRQIIDNNFESIEKYVDEAIAKYQLNNEELITLRKLNDELIISKKEYRKNKTLINYFKQNFIICVGFMFFVNIIIVLMINTILKKYF